MTSINLGHPKLDHIEGTSNNAFVDTEKEDTRATEIHDQTTHIFVHRPAFTAKSLAEQYGFKKVQSEDLFRNTTNYLKKYYMPNKTCMQNYFFEKLPFFVWIFSYDFKENFVKDVFSGITVNSRLFVSTLLTL